MEKWNLNVECPIGATMKVLSGKWKIWILFMLMDGTKRFSSLMNLKSGITQRMLTANLRELEADGMVIRTVYPVVPPKVEYSLSEVGKTIEPVLIQMQKWGACYLQKMGHVQKL